MHAERMGSGAEAFARCPARKTRMSIDQFIDNEVKGNEVVLFLKGTPQFPMRLLRPGRADPR
jgi:hypothetical protein